MKKKILVLTGSPRKNGNSDRMAEAFIKGAQSAGHEVVKIVADSKNIKGCKACDACYSKGAACVFNDDFNEIAPHLESADAIAFITPLYWYTFPVQLKAVIDKFYAFSHTQRPSNIKESYLLACAGDKEETAFEGLVKSYEHIAGYQKWQQKGQLLVAGVYEVGEIDATDALARAEKMGAAV